MWGLLEDGIGKILLASSQVRKQPRDAVASRVYPTFLFSLPFLVSGKIIDRAWKRRQWVKWKMSLLLVYSSP